MKNIARLARCLSLCLVALTAAGCSQTMGPSTPSTATVLALRSADFPAMRVGSFAPAPGMSPRMDKAVTSRSVTLGSPTGSLSGYLGSVVEADLRAAGKLDPQSPLVLSGLLTESDLDTGMGTGDGTLGAKFTLTKSGTTVYEKTLQAKAEWESSFIGAVAIPAAINGYTALYGKLVDQLVADPDLKAAARK
jgi:hypothetical protein